MSSTNKPRKKAIPEPVKLVTSDGKELDVYLIGVSSQHDLFKYNELRVELKLSGIFKIGQEEDIIKSLKSHVFPVS